MFLAKHGDLTYTFRKSAILGSGEGKALSNFMNWLTDGSNSMELISCIFTVLALVFTLYFWLLDKLSDDEADFRRGRAETLALLNDSLRTIRTCRTSRDPEQILKAAVDVDEKLQLVLNYRFWERDKHRDNYNKIKTFYEDNRYLISTIRRSRDYLRESESTPKDKVSLLAVPELTEAEIDDIVSDYDYALNYIIEFLENWG